MTKHYYNEIDSYAAQWLRNLMLKGHLPRGDVDTRCIEEVRADDLRGYAQCHFFAGIGGWPLALRMASWPDTRPAWTGSCPCQPFSAAGKQQGKSDQRHLWPVWFRLIRECHPPVVFGEQVASAIAHEWLDETAHDLEGQGYAVATTVLPACSVGAPHRRDRLWFVAHSASEQMGPARQPRKRQHVADAAQQLLDGRGNARTGRRNEFANRHDVGNARGERLEIGPQPNDQPGNVWLERPSPIASSHGGWGSEWYSCPDGKARPVKPGVRLLANGVPARVGRLRAYGNAIVPQVAAEVIAAFLKCLP